MVIAVFSAYLLQHLVAGNLLVDSYPFVGYLLVVAVFPAYLLQLLIAGNVVLYCYPLEGYLLVVVVVPPFHPPFHPPFLHPFHPPFLLHLLPTDQLLLPYSSLEGSLLGNVMFPPLKGYSFTAGYLYYTHHGMTTFIHH